MGTPPAPTYDTIFYGVIELSLPEIFGYNLLLYIQFIDDVLDPWKRYNEEYNSAELQAFQDTIQNGMDYNGTSKAIF